LRALTELQEAKLIRRVPRALRLFVVFGLDTGARLSEVQTLRWGDVSAESVLLGREGKTSNGRPVPLPERLRELLAERRAELGATLDPRALVFPGRPPSPALMRQWGIWIDAPGLVWTTLRGTFVSRAIQNHSEAQVRGWLGHGRYRVELVPHGTPSA
jgi:integrase